jgi:hypothetical protein
MAARHRLLLLGLLALCAGSAAAAREEDGDGFKTENEKLREEAAKYVYCEVDNCYDVLGVKRTAVPFAIKRAYRKLAAEYHPDKNPDPRAKEVFQKYTNAYEVRGGAASAPSRRPHPSFPTPAAAAPLHPSAAAPRVPPRRRG